MGKWIIFNLIHLCTAIHRSNLEENENNVFKGEEFFL